VWPVLPGRRRRHGGVKKWEVARQDIIRTLKEGRYCSTMFDYYALPDDWPGREESRSRTWNERALYVESRILDEIASVMGDGFRRECFIPYIQLHEFEALAFANVESLASVAAPLARHSAEALTKAFAAILDNAGHPEAINDGYDTCPSRRIARIVPAYRKRLHGPIVTRRIGLEVLRDKCTHFASWLKCLESIQSETGRSRL
jgi:hypothetical protein